MRETLLILSFFINCVCVLSIVFETPKNLAVCVGQRSSLKCKTSNGTIVREWIFRNGTSGDLKLFSNWAAVNLPSAESGYGVDVDFDGSGELYINNTQMENAGKYTCVTDYNGITHYYAELIVLETEPVCTETNHDDFTFEAECSVKYSGNWVPKMEWTHNKDINITKISNTTSNTQVNSKVDAVTRINTFRISCTIRFSHSSRSDGVSREGPTATNVPDYVYVWTANTAAREVSDATGTIGTTHSPTIPERSGGIRKSITLMHVVAALVFASI